MTGLAAKLRLSVVLPVVKCMEFFLFDKSDFYSYGAWYNHGVRVGNTNDWVHTPHPTACCSLARYITRAQSHKPSRKMFLV